MIGEVALEEETPTPFPPDPHPLPSSWKTVGEIAFGFFALIACSAPFLAKRRRIIAQQQAAATIPILDQAPLVSYDELSTEARPLVYQVISPLNNDLFLALNQRELRSKGDQIRETLHPFKFLEIIFLHPELRATVQRVFEPRFWDLTAGFKQSNFLEGVRWGMEKEARRGQLLCYVADFSQRMGLDLSRVRSFIQSQDWDGLVRYLCTDSKVPAPSLGLRV